MPKEAGGIAGRLGGIDLWLVAGASLYWAAIVVQFQLTTGFAGAAAAGVDDLVKYAVLTAFAGFGFAFKRVFLRDGGRRVLSGGVAVIVLALMLVQAASGRAAIPSWASAVMFVAHMFSIAMLMIVWGFAFASMDKRQAGSNVAVTMLAAALLVLVLIGTASRAPAVPLARLFMAGSAAIVALGRVCFIDRRRTRQKGPRSPLVPFVLSRVAFGAVLGASLEMPRHLAASDASLPLAALGACLLAVNLACYGKSPERLYTALPSLLFVAVGVVYLPFFQGGLLSAAEAAPGLIWLVWAAFSAFQLSDIKERCGMGELVLCLVEKCILSCAIALGIAAVYAAGALGLSPDETACAYLVFAVTCALVTGTAYVMAYLVSARKDDEMRAELAKSRKQRQDEVLAEVADEFGLSAREREVAEMLAEGYTYAYIRAALGVSDGTVKSHVAHVYQKLAIHRKDEMLELIDRRMG